MVESVEDAMVVSVTGCMEWVRMEFARREEKATERRVSYCMNLINSDWLRCVCSNVSSAGLRCNAYKLENSSHTMQQSESSVRCS